MKFSVEDKDPRSGARAGKFRTAHGDIPTPVFMPVGTAGTVKGVHQHELSGEINAPVILGNTYHLFLRPGMDVLHKAGGLHAFMNWQRPILTDSGGYQVFSLAENRKINREGVLFRSHIDGSKHSFTPESVVDMQRIIGSDIMMALDECTPYPCKKSYARESLELTNHWLERGKQHFMKSGSLYDFEQFWVPIVQGSVYKDLRQSSAEFVASLDMPANAIGGLSVGEPEEQMYEMVEVVHNILPAGRPRYLMGVGTPANLLECIALGIDMFDCVLPTRNGRNGQLFTSRGIINIRNEKWQNDYSPLDESGLCRVDTQYSRAYLRHLIMAKELLGAQIASIHNLCFYMWLMKEARAQIASGDFRNWKDSMVPHLTNRL